MCYSRVVTFIMVHYIVDLPSCLITWYWWYTIITWQLWPYLYIIFNVEFFTKTFFSKNKLWKNHRIFVNIFFLNMEYSNWTNFWINNMCWSCPCTMIYIIVHTCKGNNQKWAFFPIMFVNENLIYTRFYGSLSYLQWGMDGWKSFKVYHSWWKWPNRNSLLQFFFSLI